MKYSFWFELTFFPEQNLSTYTAFTKLDKKKLRLLFIPKGLICATFGTRERHSKEGFLTLQLHFNNNKFFSSSLLQLPIYLNQRQRTLRDLVYYLISICIFQVDKNLGSSHILIVICISTITIKSYDLIHYFLFCFFNGDNNIRLLQQLLIC